MKFLIQILFFIMGLILFSFGISVAIKVQYLGIHPWDVLNLTLHKKIGLSIGSWNIIVGLFLVSITLFLDRKYVHIGTFLNAILVGILVDFFVFLDLTPHYSSDFINVLILLCAITLMGFGGGMYSAAGIGAGPRDGFMLSISEKLGLSIRIIRIAVETIVLIIGLLLGGSVFIFTFIYTLIQSPIFQFSFLLCSKGLKRMTLHLEQSKNAKSA
ncbi:YczE/YyaS/YitT family protein [Halobacillus aidingensis]|uniref:Membrane protein YczE n=1 Tax=Halobacillus aidingensis TaxID=240303 RepID=A0A1H0UF04_HALAD|nr:YitT family protein [Halobacillus aidingensis]SDP64446.1 hypothetical protein SAMN05421677_12563 [Halobacillus aidingensis]